MLHVWERKISETPRKTRRKKKHGSKSRMKNGSVRDHGTRNPFLLPHASSLFMTPVFWRRVPGVVTPARERRGRYLVIFVRYMENRGKWWGVCFFHCKKMTQYKKVLSVKN
jgi:hypothetical protein